MSFFVKKQCKSIAERSGQQCQRTFRTFTRRRYCYQHQPKVLFISSMIFSALFGLFLGKSYDYFIPSDENMSIIETKSIINSNNLQRSDIKSIYLVLEFSEKLKPKDFHLDGILFFITSPLQFGEGLRTSALFTQSDTFVDKAVWGLSCETSITSLKDIDTSPSRITFSTHHKELSLLPIPVSLFNSQTKPINSIADINNYKLNMFISEKLSSNVNRVKLLLNISENFDEYLVILDKPTDHNVWEKTNYQLNQKESEKYIKDNNFVKLKSALDIKLKDLEVNNGTPIPIQGYLMEY